MKLTSISWEIGYKRPPYAPCRLIGHQYPWVEFRYIPSDTLGIKNIPRPTLLSHFQWHLHHGLHMTLAQILNLVGLLCITVGSIAAALGSPSPKYGPDGSVSLAGESDQVNRIAPYRRQKNFGNFLFIVAFGAFLQAVAVFLPSGHGG